MEFTQSVSVHTMKRLPTYLKYLKSLDEERNVSSTEIAKALGLNDVQVRKDLSAVSSRGRPRVGYHVKALIEDLKEFLGYNAINKAVLVGAGNLGRALMSYRGFEEYGLRIVAGFDLSSDVVGSECGGKPILPMETLRDFCSSEGVRIGVITTPASAAQSACNLLIESGIKAVWNFAPTHVTVPRGVLVQNENMASSLALLSKHLNEMLNND
ncbi:MAG: redox-sensing transcriptional repressor Rex [Clostridia bacterium]|nr:redox-sensing transcriptional repressor Rex [Clostridia bacterium]